MAAISSSVSGSWTTLSRLDSYSFRLVENGIGVCPRWTAHLTQTTAGCTPWSLAMRTTTGSSMSTVSSGVLSLSGRSGDPMGQNPIGWIPLAYVREQLGLLKMGVELHFVHCGPDPGIG